MHDETELVLLAKPILAEAILKLEEYRDVTPWAEDVEELDLLIDKLERSMNKANKEIATNE